MSDEIAEVPEQKRRDLLGRSRLSVPLTRVKERVGPASVASAERAGAESRLAELGKSEYLSVKGELHERLLDELNNRKLLSVGEEALTEAVRDFVGRVLEVEDLTLNEAERKQLADDLIEETVGAGPLASLMADPAVTDILVNGPDQVYIERFGRLEATDVRFRDTEHLLRIIQRIATRVGRRVDESSPMVDARLPDGSRVNATIPPVAIDGPTLSIRRFGRQRLRRSDLLRMGMLSEDMETFLEMAIQARKNILISGGTGAGKTTFLGALAESIPATERIITIEDAAELILDQRHVVRLENRPVNIEGRGQITTRDLVINSLRMRPDRIIVGEVRGPEALDMLQAMNTGHDGSLTTVHANSSRDALARLETMVLMAGVDLPSRAIREQVVSAIYLIVHVRRFEDGIRRVAAIVEILGLEGLTPVTQELFKFERRGRKGRNIVGEFVATGIVPRLVEELRERDVQVPMKSIPKTEEAGGMNDYVRVGLVLALPVALTAIFILWRRIHLRELTRAALEEPETSVARPAPSRARPINRRFHFLPWIIAVVLAGCLYLFAWLPPIFAVSFAVVIGLMLARLETFRLSRITLRIEEQLADAIDLMVAALRVGSGALSALEAAARETRAPSKSQLEEVLGRIRYGEDAQVVLRALEKRVPLETFRLFTSALAVHWETGGSLAATLATVGKVIRDRIEVQRRIRALSTQARVSTISVLLVTYFIALIIWRNDPERMRRFLATTVGQFAVAGAIMLQAVGLVWASALSRLKY